MAGRRRASCGDVVVGVSLVVGDVIGAILLVELAQPGDAFVDRSDSAGRSSTSGLTLVRRKWSGHEVPSSARANSFVARQELEHFLGIGEVAHHALIMRGDARRTGAKAAAFSRRSSGASGSPCRRPVRRRAVARRALDVVPGRLDDPEAVGLRLLAGGTPGRDPVATEHHPDGLGVGLVDRRDVEAQLESRAAPGDPGDPAAKDVFGQPLAVRRRRDGDAAVGMQMIDVRGVRPARALPCRWMAQPRRGRAGRSRRRSPSRPPGPPGIDDTRARSLSRRRTARPDSLRVPRSPPDPLTHMSSTSPPVTGSRSMPLAEALPPA